MRINESGKVRPLKVTRLQSYEGPRLVPIDVAVSGDIAVLSGLDEVAIGDTICTSEEPKALPRIRVDEPTVSMLFTAQHLPPERPGGHPGAIQQTPRTSV